MSLEIARRIAEACKQRARELRSPVSIAIVDAGGHLVLFERMMAPYGWATANISIAKAVTAVMFNQPTDAVAQWGSAIPGFASSLAVMTQGRFIMAAGGWPIRLGGATIGGIGISGGNAPGRDDEIARAGLAALEALAPALLPQLQPHLQPSVAYPSSSPGLSHELTGAAHSADYALQEQPTNQQAVSGEELRGQNSEQVPQSEDMASRKHLAGGPS
ncbi:GlcG/HbpS family heme-binding protein [Thermogemmatispora sp.]|uniref:GlcG/HbpS family heme-binding protein n=1 Tax=Thermogemmatispora sp. TaxID=1968838 RepID=UPI001D1AA567|nr:heme-binding protein [Thermogemmatispora sp.]MBX5450047.1 heme-binding protein [Thermogemmatispora sp.]